MRQGNVFWGRVFRQSVVIEGLPRAIRPQMGREASNSVGDNSILSNRNRIVNEKRKNVSRFEAVARDDSERISGGRPAVFVIPAQAGIQRTQNRRSNLLDPLRSSGSQG